MSDILLKVEVMAGAEIGKASKQICDLAKKLGINVEFDFNGQSIIVRPDSIAKDVHDKYLQYCDRK